ncbi:hypothetical protein ACFPYJ_33110 [Paenibacillus solisilvae]|uniref:DUF4901 domain-containing protein n=1 Tax=Paenibacillus solisilvae TaxID=2486751 RepID=A0ABW0W9A4_9BACL
MTTMKLISKEKGIESVQKWFELPQSNKIKKAVYRRNHDINAPFYTLDLQWSKGIEVDLDALTGQIVEFRRKEPILDTGKPSEMDHDVFEILHSKVLDGLDKLELPVDASELLVFKKSVEGNNERFELEYARQRDGFNVRDYQRLYFAFNKKHDIVGLRVRWDDVEFVTIEKHLTIEEIKQKLSPEQLVLVYSPRQKNPIYACKDEWFDVATGRKTVSEELSVVRIIKWEQPINVKKKKIKAPSKPLISNKLFESLILEDGITEIDLTNPHPFKGELTEEEQKQSIEIAISCLQEQYPDESGHFALVKRSDKPMVESEFGNIVVRFHRVINGIPSLGTAIQIWVDRNKGKVLMVHDPQEMWEEKAGNKVDTSQDVIPVETAWSQLKDKIDLKLGYRLHPYNLLSESPQKRLATLEYELQCDWICDAITNEVY